MKYILRWRMMTGYKYIDVSTGEVRLVVSVSEATEFDSQLEALEVRWKCFYSSDIIELLEKESLKIIRF